MTLLYSLLDHMRRLLQIRQRHVDAAAAASSGPTGGGASMDAVGGGSGVVSSSGIGLGGALFGESSAAASTPLTEKLEKLIVLHTKVHYGPEIKKKRQKK